MSQEKVDKYKEEKANRKKNVAKQKRNAVIGRIAGVLVVVLLIAYIGWSGYRNHKEEESQSLMWSSIMDMINSQTDATTTSGETTTKGETSATDESTSEKESSKESESESKSEEETSENLTEESAGE